MHMLQRMMDAMNEASSRERSGYHLTLGGLIAKLEPHTGKGLVVPLGEPDSYRGYYVDLAFDSGSTPLDDFLDRCRKAVGETFQGYKGGDYTMHEGTPLWVAPYGCCGSALRDVVIDDGGVTLVTKYIG